MDATESPVAYNDAGGPGVEQQDRADQEGAGQHHADRQQEPVSEADVLLPEQEGVSVRVVEHALAAELVADGPHALDGFHKVAGLPEAVQVEGELGKLQRLCSWDCRRGKLDVRSLAFFEALFRCIQNNRMRHLLRRFSPVVSYLS